jgi:hypothetical protein
MKKLVLTLIVLLAASLACSSVQIADPAFSPPAEATPDALATVLAEVAQVTEKAPDPTNTPVLPTATATQEGDETAEPTAEGGATFTPTPAPTSTRANTGYPTAISLPEPSASNFFTCLNECAEDGSNDQDTFPERIELIHFQYEFKEFSFRAPYTRTWYKDGVLWAHYSCTWPGEQSGVDKITLTDPGGLASGVWNVVIEVNGEEVLNETILIDGTYTYWSPPGYFNGCYGKK